MQIIDFFISDRKDYWLSEIKKGEWRAIPTLAGLIENNTFHKELGEGTLLLLTEGEKLVSFVTFAERDCISDGSLTPWVGFVYTFPEYRGHRYAGKLIGHCEEIASERRLPRVYICTDHVGLYEKYGYTYLESRDDIYGGISRIYFKNISQEN